MELFKSSLFAIPLFLVALWMVAGVFGARLAPRPGSDRWHIVSKIFHWVMAFSILGTTALMYYSQTYEALAAEDPAMRAEYAELLKWHKSIGLIVLFLVLFRLAWNRSRPRPALPSGLAAGQRRAALGAHHLLYLLMFLVPLFGWMASMAYGGRTRFFDLFEMPQWLDKNLETVNIYYYGHMWMGWVLFAALATHLAAALWHHFVRQDETLARMLPWGRRNGS
jgi:cytochrome b561